MRSAAQITGRNVEDSQEQTAPTYEPQVCSPIPFAGADHLAQA